MVKKIQLRNYASANYILLQRLQSVMMAGWSDPDKESDFVQRGQLR